MTIDKPTPVPFPERGVDTADAYATQPAASTPDAQNVRAVDPASDRARGGRRPGLSRLIDQRLPL